MAKPGDSGHFIPTTQVWDIQEIYSTEVTSPQFKELLVRLYQNLNTHAMATNAKDTGTYHTEEFVNGQMFFPGSGSKDQRNVFRKVINFGALPDGSGGGAVASVAHDITITKDMTFTRIYGTASKQTVPYFYLPIPYVSATDSIELYVDATNVNIATVSDLSAYTKAYVVLEYLKQ